MTHNEASEPFPTFQDLADSAAMGIGRRALARYYIQRNPAASIRRHERLGTPLARKVIMNTVGRLVQNRTDRDTRYRLNQNRPPMEAATHFALHASVSNEGIHLLGIGYGAEALLTNQPGYLMAAAAVLTAVQVPIVAVQRYNRARMIQRVDEQLAAGEVFQQEYRNNFGIDGRAYQTWQAAQTAENPQAVQAEESGEQPAE